MIENPDLAWAFIWMTAALLSFFFLSLIRLEMAIIAAVIFSILGFSSMERYLYPPATVMQMAPASMPEHAVPMR